MPKFAPRFHVLRRRFESTLATAKQGSGPATPYKLSAQRRYEASRPSDNQMSLFDPSQGNMVVPMASGRGSNDLNNLARFVGGALNVIGGQFRRQEDMFGEIMVRALTSSAPSIC